MRDRKIMKSDVYATCLYRVLETSTKRRVPICEVSAHDVFCEFVGQTEWVVYYLSLVPAINKFILKHGNIDNGLASNINHLDEICPVETAEEVRSITEIYEMRIMAMDSWQSRDPIMAFASDGEVK